MTKRCPRCKVWKPTGEFHKKSSTRDGLACYCKTCKKKIAAKWYKDNREQERERRRQHYAENRETYIENARRRYWENPRAKSEYDKRRYKQKREEILQYQSDYYQCNKEHVKARVKRYRQDNPEKEAGRARRRRAKEKGAEGYFTEEHWERLCNLSGGTCLCCGKDEDITVDHVVPLTRGGTNWINNIQPLCRSCNSSKGNRDFTDYRSGNVWMWVKAMMWEVLSEKGRLNWTHDNP